MNAQRRSIGELHRVVPRPGGQLRHAGPDRGGDHCAGQAGATTVENAYNVAVSYAPSCGVDGIDEDRFATLDLAGEAECTDVELAVQPRRGLVGDQVQREQTVVGVIGFDPGRVSWAIVVTEACDGFRIDLDSAAWRRQLVVEGIVPEGAQKAADEIKPQLQEAGKKLKEGAQTAAEKTGEAMQQAGKSMQNKAEEAKKKDKP